ncbi:FliG C-terminal domain-containing protein [Gracilimonas tropica]|uniref:FliG C-terminal domain-containing protein n=1 Tax=Gracilimonas tropica TaxID=454600 RepID=UPI00036AFAC6|nr:FliG C-terminal domain-containing protein [Gracilimonas tropica]
MNRVRIGILLTGVMILFSLTAEAQTPGNRSSSPDETEEATKYEQYYEVVLDRSLREYYEKGTYIVDVKASVERVMVAKGYDVVEPPPGIELENLPGLPVIPPNLRNSQNQQDSLKISGFDSSYKLTGLNVKVLVDTSYTDEDIEFIEEAAAMVTNADLLRGDVITVTEKVFPGIERDVARPDEEIQALRRELMDQQDESQQQSEPNMFLGIDWNDPKQLMYVIAGLGLLFIGALLFLAFRKPAREEQKLSQYPYEPNFPAQIQGNGSSADEEAKNEVREIKGDKQQQFEKDKMYITNACVSDPGMVAELISGWVEDDEDEGIVRAVRHIYSVDHKLMDVLESHLEDEIYNSIQFGLSNIDTIPIEEKVEEVEQFKKSIQGVKKERRKEDSESNLFDFLDQLSNQQLMHLVKGESDEMTAILLAQVAGERSSYVLQKMKDQKRVSVVLKMGKINNIPVSIYKKVAAHFSSKALSVSDMKFVAADGVESILSTIDSMPVSEQEGFVSSIAEQDLELAKKIRKYFVAFEDIPKMDDEILQNSIESLETDKLIQALYGAKDEVRQKILRVRPKREQQLILSELGNTKDLKRAEVEKARKELLSEIRKYLKIAG